jgi:uncharacterized protein (TIGR00730 family)
MPRAYYNTDFLGSRDARAIRILCEYLEPQGRFAKQNVKDTIVFYGSARSIPPRESEALLTEAKQAGVPARIRQAEYQCKLSRYYDDARILAGMITAWSKTLSPTERRFIVCSGGGPGMMEAANKGAIEAGGPTIGLGISLPMEETGNDYITPELEYEFHYFFMRKFWFVYLAKAVAVFPGGYGTCDEFFELLTLIQTGRLSKDVPIILYGREFWQDVLDLEKLVKWGTISEEDLDLFKVVDSPEEAFEYLTERLTRLYLPSTGALNGP